MKSVQGFDPSLVSEELWGHWRETVRRCGVGDYMLGQLAPTLQALPTVIWRTPLEDYLDVSLDEMRSMKTHGEKRVHAILEVFGCVHDALATSTIQAHLDMRLTPKFVAPIANWIVETLEDSGETPTAEDLHENVAAPLVKQIEIDLGKQISRLASARVSLSRNCADRPRRSEADGCDAGPRLSITGRLREGDPGSLAARALVDGAAWEPAGDLRRRSSPFALPRDLRSLFPGGKVRPRSDRGDGVELGRIPRRSAPRLLQAAGVLEPLSDPDASSVRVAGLLSFGRRIVDRLVQRGALAAQDTYIPPSPTARRPSDTTWKIGSR